MRPFALVSFSLLFALASAACGKDQPAAGAPAAASGAAGASATGGGIVGKWTKKDDAKIVWTFAADGSETQKTSFNEFPGSYTLTDKKLEIKAKDMGAKTYTVQELSANKLVVKDDGFGVVSEFAR